MKFSHVIALGVRLFATTLGTCSAPIAASAVPAATFASLALNGTVSETVSPSPAVAVNMSTLGELGDANGTLSYYFEFLGPPVPFPVTLPVWISGNLDADASTTPVPSEVDSVTSWASVTIFPGFATLEKIECSSSSGAPDEGYCGSKSFTDALSIFDNLVYRVDVSAGSVGLYGSGSAMADPSIYIDPTFPNASEYTFEISAGIGNPAPSLAVPEPMPLTLLGMGLAGIGVVMRRRTVTPWLLAGALYAR